MADFEYHDASRTGGVATPHPGVAGDGPGLGALINWAGALVSVGLVVGMGFWAWQLTMRDVSGVPVIQALEGPMRVPPQDPGGAQAPNQGLSVNRIAEGAEAAPVPDQLVLAPPPVDLEAITLASGSVPDVATVVLADAVASPAAQEPRAPVNVTPEDINAQTQALIERLIAGSTPLEPVEQGAAPVLTDSAAPVAPVAGPVATLSVIPNSVPGVARSLRPAARPADMVMAVAASADRITPQDAALNAEIDPVALAEGTRLVQLGAFDSPDVARGEWDRLAGRFPDYFADRARVIQEARSGGSAFYRLRAHGFDDLAASRRFCAVLMAQGAACIPVTVR